MDENAEIYRTAERRQKSSCCIVLHNVCVSFFENSVAGLSLLACAIAFLVGAQFYAWELWDCIFQKHTWKVKEDQYILQKRKSK